MKKLLKIHTFKDKIVNVYTDLNPFTSKKEYILVYYNLKGKKYCSMTVTTKEEVDHYISTTN